MSDELNTLVLNLDSGGDVVIKLRPDLASGHVARIKELAEEGFYDGVKFQNLEEELYGVPVYKQEWYKRLRSRKKGDPDSCD